MRLKNSGNPPQSKFKRPDFHCPLLIDAKTMAAENPKTFRRPSYFNRRKLQLGDFVKVTMPCQVPLAGQKMGGERFWVKLTEINWPGLTGTVANDLLNNHLKLGDSIRFHEDNIYDIQFASEKP